MTPSTFPTFLTFLTFGLVRAGWLKLVTTKAGGRAIHWWQVSPLLFPGHLRQKGRKGQKGGACHADEHLSDLSDTEAAVPGHLGEIPGRASGAPRKPWAADRDPAEEKASR
jgi:hypothetical protein